MSSEPRPRIPLLVGGFLEVGDLKRRLYGNIETFPDGQGGCCRYLIEGTLIEAEPDFKTEKDLYVASIEGVFEFVKGRTHLSMRDENPDDYSDTIYKLVNDETYGMGLTGRYVGRWERYPKKGVGKVSGSASGRAFLEVHATHWPLD